VQLKNILNYYTPFFTAPKGAGGKLKKARRAFSEFNSGTVLEGVNRKFCE
jgi:hypothetical protein